MKRGPSKSEVRRLAVQNPEALYEEIANLRTELKRARCEVNQLYRRLAKCADADRVIDWLRNGTQQAVFAFTSGPERSICYEMERLWKRKGESHLDVMTPVELRRDLKIP